MSRERRSGSGDSLWVAVIAGPPLVVAGAALLNRGATLSLVSDHHAMGWPEALGTAFVAVVALVVSLVLARRSHALLVPVAAATVVAGAVIAHAWGGLPWAASAVVAPIIGAILMGIVASIVSGQ